MGGQEDAGCEERLDGSRAFRGPRTFLRCQLIAKSPVPL